MSKIFDFHQLFICDLANNHQGDVRHGQRIIQNVGAVAQEKAIRMALKFQFRDVETLIHPAHKEQSANKHIPRFLSTFLKMEDYQILLQEVRDQGMVTMVTPFDEVSVDRILESDVDIIKIASCSAKDRPLLEKVAQTGHPVVISTAGLSLSHIDWVVNFFEHKRIHFALMHCVAIYPTRNAQLNLNQIDCLKERYPNIPIGFSTHEDPTNTSAIQMAYAKGAQLFERHVGVSTEIYSLNAYSSTPELLRAWIDAYHNAVASCGGECRAPAPPSETESLISLKRGIYASRAIKKGEEIERGDVFFAMPVEPEQLVSEQWRDGMIADRSYQKDEPILENLACYDVPQKQLIFEIMLQVKGLLNNARIFVSDEHAVEISHHYGIDRFREFGCVIIECINRSYCKKLIVMLPRQKHPYHFHKKKEETFQLLYGDLEVELEGQRIAMDVGETLLVPPERWHKFHTLDGAIFEEVSTTHYHNDSFYDDERISKISREKRKTTIDKLSQFLSYRNDINDIKVSYV